MRALRIVGIVIGCIVAVLIAAVIALLLIVNPNDYKGRIETAVRNSTGRDLTLQGNIHLAVFPSIALELGPATLGNPPGFSASQPFASLQRVSLRVRVLPLLHHQLDVGRIEIDGLDLRLLKNAQGQGNWSMPPGKQTTPAPQSSGSQMTLGGIGGVVIKNSRVSYEDMTTDHVDIDIGHVATGVPVPVKWNLSVTTAAGGRPIALSGNATMEYDSKTAQLSDLDAHVDDSTLRGSAAVTNLTTGAMTFDLSIDQIDLDRYLGTTSKAKSAAAPPPPAAAQARQATELPTGALKTLQLNGKLAIGTATLYGMKLSQVDVGLAASGGVLHISPASAKLYDGTSTGDVTVDAHGAVPVLHLNENLAGIQIQPLLTDFAKLNRVSGRGNVTLNVTAQGNTTAALMKSLDGHAAVNLANGAIQGVNLWSAINGAVALAERQSLPARSGGNSTPFDAFSASADLNDGVATTKDLNIASGDLHVTGQGTANLVTEAVDYRVNAAVLKGAGSSSALANIPLLITGTMTSPTVRPDTQALVKSVAQQQLQKQKGAVVNKLRNALKGLIH
ncbi:MAG TPA: AsmA family protein [Steroidobacteraceae bacterium]|nr:AsmA family protein [Steroidobacteraceae bacterium]